MSQNHQNAQSHPQSQYFSCRSEINIAETDNSHPRTRMTIILKFGTCKNMTEYNMITFGDWRLQKHFIAPKAWNHKIFPEEK